MRGHPRWCCAQTWQSGTLRRRGRCPLGWPRPQHPCPAVPSCRWQCRLGRCAASRWCCRLRRAAEGRLGPAQQGSVFMQSSWGLATWRGDGPAVHPSRPSLAWGGTGVKRGRLPGDACFAHAAHHGQHRLAGQAHNDASCGGCCACHGSDCWVVVVDGDEAEGVGARRHVGKGVGVGGCGIAAWGEGWLAVRECCAGPAWCALRQTR